MTASTAGIGNPAVSAAEDATSLLMTLLAFVLSVLAFLLVVAVLGLIIWLAVRPRDPGCGPVDQPDRTPTTNTL